MREFTIRFIEVAEKDYVRVECDFGDPATASPQENHRAQIMKLLIHQAVRIFPNVTAIATGDNVQETIAKVNIQEDIRQAGQ